MAAKQTRRAFGMTDDAYDRVTKHAEANGISRSSILEKLINGFLDRVEAGAPEDLTAQMTRLNLELRRK